MANNEQGSLRHGAIKVTDLMMIAIGGMVGSAIFSLAGPTYMLAGPSAILTWVIAAGILAIYALNLAELASAYRVAGGTFAFPALVIGKNIYRRTFIGWLSGWGRLWDVLIAISFTSLYFAQYLGALFPGAERFQVSIAIITIVITAVLNSLGIKIMGKANTVLTVLLLLSCGIFIVFAFINMNPSHFVPFFGQGTGGKNGIFQAIPIAMLGYGCIIAVSNMAEEVENPKKNIPKAIFLGVGITAGLYVLMLIATYGLVPWQDFIDNPAALYAPQRYAVETAMPQNIWLTKLISLGALLALMTTLLVLCMDAGRTIMTVARAGLMPSILGKVNTKTGTPIFAIVLASLVGIVLSLFPDVALDIVKSGAMTQAITIAIIAFTVIIHRRKTKVVDPEAFRAPGGIVFPILTIIIVATLLTQFPSRVYIISLIGYGIGLLIYFIAYCTNRKNFALISCDSNIENEEDIVSTK